MGGISDGNRLKEVLGSAWTVIDTSLGAHVTDANPSISFFGRVWFRPASQEIWVNTTGGWRYIGGPSTKYKFVSYDLDAAIRTTNASVKVTECTFNEVSGRQYLIRYSSFLKWDNPEQSNGNLIFEFKNKDNVIIRIDGWQDTGGQIYLAQGEDVEGFFIYTAPSTGSQRISIWFNADQGAGTAKINVGNRQTNLLVQEIGGN